MSGAAIRWRMGGGTRFRLLPQYDEDMALETVEVSSPRGSLAAGPTDATMHVVLPLRKPQPYDPPQIVPPYQGPHQPPARPGPEGHFDHIPMAAPQFLSAHLFGVVRHTLDVWETYLRRPLVWWHAQEYPRLELIPLVEWQNAQSGPGFLETGIWPATPHLWQALALNHDVVSHEVGHTVMFSTIGVPNDIDREFLGFHESFSDLVALVTGLHFASVRRKLLQQTDGNLYVLNLVSRIGETATHGQIRIASNTRRMADVADLMLQPDGTWRDPTGQGRNAHAYAEPLTGAVFDVLVELFQEGLVRRGLIRDEGGDAGWTRAEVADALSRVARRTTAAYRVFAEDFEESLCAARDALGRAMAHVMLTLPANEIGFDRVAARLLEGLAAAGWGGLLEPLVTRFTARGIDPAPYLRFTPVPARPDLVVVAPAPPRRCRCGTSDMIVRARRLMPHTHREEGEGG